MDLTSIHVFSPEILIYIEYQMLPLHIACRRHLPDVARMLLEEDYVLQLATEDQEGRVPLHLACMMDDKTPIRTVEELLSILLLQEYFPAYHVVKTDYSGSIPLHYAVKSGSAACVEMLLQHDPEFQVLARDSAEKCAFWGAIANGSTAVLERLLQWFPEEQLSAYHGIIRQNYKSDQPVQQPNKLQEPILSARQHGNIDAIFVVLKYRPDQVVLLRPNEWNFLIEENQDAFQAFANLFILGFLLEEHLDLVVHGTARDRMVKEIVSNRKLKSAKA